MSKRKIDKILFWVFFSSGEVWGENWMHCLMRLLQELLNERSTWRVGNIGHTTQSEMEPGGTPFKENGIPHMNLARWVPVVVCFLKRKAPVQWVFSQMNDIWTVAINRFMEKPAKDKAILRQMHYSEKCIDEVGGRLFCIIPIWTSNFFILSFTHFVVSVLAVFLLFFFAFVPNRIPEPLNRCSQGHRFISTESVM